MIAPAAPYRLSRVWLLAGFLPAILGGCLDYQLGALSWKIVPIAQWHLNYSCAWLALLALTDREGPWRRRAAWFGGWTLAGLLVCFLLHDLADRESRRDVIKMLGASPALYLWLAGIWMSVPLLMARRPEGTPRPGWMRGAVGALAVYNTLCLASAVASVDPSESLWYVYFERGLPLALIPAWWRAAEIDSALRRRTGGATVWILGSLIVLAAAIGLLDWLGGPALHERLVAWQLIYQNTEPAGVLLPERRLLFPMLHFNRTAWFAMIAMMAGLLAWLDGRARPGRWHWLALGVTLLALAVIYQSHTRAVLVVAVAGLAVWAVLNSRRWAGALALGLLLAAAVLPERHIAHIASVLEPAAWQIRTGPLNSVKARLIAFEWGVGEIGRNPVTGMGYGRKTVFGAMREYIATEGDQRLRESVESGHEMNHLHNLWLETAAESGLPAALALLAFLGLRWWALARWWLRARGPERQRAAAWLVFEGMLLAAGLGYYMLKQNSGLLTWWVWAYALLAADAGLRISDEAACATDWASNAPAPQPPLG